MELIDNLFSRLRPIQILDKVIPIADYCPIDLSITNKEIKSLDISNADECQKYITAVLKRNEAQVAYGGYLEQRDLYGSSKRFEGEEPRNIHLGLDFWCEAGTKVGVPIDGVVHSFANNSDFGNYGPTIILEHSYEGYSFYSLYGHLSTDSLENIHVGKSFARGEVLCRLGTPEINVGYAPHLHFQLILDLQDANGDYPGVCSKGDLEFYKTNCPDPNLLLGILS